jgi:hypothetical protein
MDARNRRVLVTTGNVESGVSLSLLPLTQGSRYLGPLVESDIAGARRIFAHLKLRAGPIEPNALDNSPSIRALAIR